MPPQSALALERTDARSAMAEFEQLLASNSGEDPFETAIRLLAAKLFDELTYPQQQSRFRDTGAPDESLRVVEALYGGARKRWRWLNGIDSSIGISASSLTRCIRPLTGWRLLGSDLSVLDATLERLIARDAKGQLGQYFTPREVVRFCVDVLNPHPQDSVIDPASGSGGFLFEAARHSVNQYGEAPRSLGIDLSARSIKVGALLSESHPKLNIKITKGNSLDAREHRVSCPPEWQDFSSTRSTAHSAKRDLWKELKCSVVLTNPPFAGEIDELEVLRDYESIPRSIARPRATREHLFLERSVRLLAPGGRLGIVLPQAVLANSTSSGLRSWLLSQCRLLGVIGLHPFAFLPYTSVKTSLLFVEKRRPESRKRPSAEPVFFGVSKRPGKDSSGRSSGADDYMDLSLAFKFFLASQKIEWASKPTQRLVRKVGEIVPGDEVEAAGRFDAEHFESNSREMLKRLRSIQGTDELRAFVESKIERFRKSDFANIAYVDISSVDAKTGIPSPQEMLSTEAPGRASYVLRSGDVLVSTVRPERNVVALIHGDSELPRIGSNGFCVLRPKGVAPEVIFAYCKTDTFRTLLSRHSAASMYPTVADKDVLSIPFSVPSERVQDQIVRNVRAGMHGILAGNAQISAAVSLISAACSDSYQTEAASEAMPPPYAPRNRKKTVKSP